MGIIPCVIQYILLAYLFIPGATSPETEEPTPKLGGRNHTSRPQGWDSGLLLAPHQHICHRGRGVCQRPSLMPSALKSREAKIRYPSPSQSRATASTRNKSQKVLPPEPHAPPPQVFHVTMPWAACCGQGHRPAAAMGHGLGRVCTRAESAVFSRQGLQDGPSPPNSVHVART